MVTTIKGELSNLEHGFAWTNFLIEYQEGPDMKLQYFKCGIPRPFLSLNGVHSIA